MTPRLRMALRLLMALRARPLVLVAAWRAGILATLCPLGPFHALQGAVNGAGIAVVPLAWLLRRVSLSRKGFGTPKRFGAPKGFALARFGAN